MIKEGLCEFGVPNVKDWGKVRDWKEPRRTRAALEQRMT